MDIEFSPQSKRCPRYFYHKLGRDGVDDTFDIVSVMTGKVVASLPFWNETEEDEKGVRKDADKLVEGLNSLVNYGGRLRGDNLNAAVPEPQQILVNSKGEPLEPAKPCWTEAPIPNLNWSVEDVQKVRPDLHREEAYGVLREIALLAQFGQHVCLEVIKAIADETFSVIDIVENEG